MTIKRPENMLPKSRKVMVTGLMISSIKLIGAKALKGWKKWPKKPPMPRARIDSMLTQTMTMRAIANGKLTSLVGGGRSS